MTQPRKDRRPTIKARPENAIDLKILARTLDQLSDMIAERARELQARRIAREVAQEEREEWR